MKKNKQEILSTLAALGFNTSGRTFPENINLLIQEYIKLSMEVENDNKELMKREIQRLLKPTN